ncbi:MAG: acetyl-CoA C-acyltransferase [Candidatus Neomarinimicrobiota bacterium]
MSSTDISNPGGFSARYDDVFIINGARTPFGEFMGALGSVSPTDLGIIASRAALERSGVAPADVGHVTFANIMQASFDAIYLPRHISLYCGIPRAVGALMVQRICGSGFESIIAAVEQVVLGKAGLALAGGSENMTLSPTVSFGNRQGYRLGQPGFGDMLWEGLKDPAVGCLMGETAENIAKKYGITREEVDAYALRSHTLARERSLDGTMAEELVPVASGKIEVEGLATRKYRVSPKGFTLERDEHIRETDAAGLAKLWPHFAADGVQTAGNSSGIVDGAAAVVVAGGEAVRSRGLTPLARVVASAAAGVDPETMGMGPVPAIKQVLEVAGLAMSDIDLFEINEAFGAQILGVIKELDLDLERLNVNGGVIAIGHPLAATGTRLTHTLALELRRRSTRYGIASACIGGGQGTAVLIESVS